jgi:hypothetical protein
MPRVWVKASAPQGRWRAGKLHPMAGHEIDVSDDELKALEGDAMLSVRPADKAPPQPAQGASAPTSLNEAELQQAELKKLEDAKAAAAQLQTSAVAPSELQNRPAKSSK